MLSHAGIPFQWFEEIDMSQMSSFDMIIVALADETEQTRNQLWQYAVSGGIVISYAELNAFAGKLGCEPSRIIGAGYARMGSMYEKAEALRFLSAEPWRILATTDRSTIAEYGSLVHAGTGQQSLGAALQSFKVGNGYFERWAINMASTVVMLQQGTGPVLTDGVPAPDGTGPVNDNLLKADDRIAQDWEYDRLRTETGASYFAHPYADYWRELMIGHLIRTAARLGKILPFIGFWPDGVKHVALISHDSDLNEDVHAEATLELLNECDIQSTWCMLEPGYSPYLYERLLEDGHEIGFHYNALEADGGEWNKEEFSRQLDWLKQASGIETCCSNKNHYTRFEGWSELFSWCENNGLQLDQTRGPSKKGNVGFLFGTCQPYFPIAWSNESNRMIDVVELGFLTQDLDVSSIWADSSIINPILDGVCKVGGVAHFLYHQAHIQTKEPVRRSFRKLVEEARKRDFKFWTGEQINDWYRSRRELRIESLNEHGLAVVRGREQLQAAVVWIPVIMSEDAQDDSNTDIHYGVKCKKQLVVVENEQSTMTT
ncbi:hypothetical protein [Paenibacillus agaridevorans]|nr:hypothetical protein [Paenibacillus agaridevorans]